MGWCCCCSCISLCILWLVLEIRPSVRPSIHCQSVCHMGYCATITARQTGDACEFSAFVVRCLAHACCCYCCYILFVLLCSAWSCCRVTLLVLFVVVVGVCAIIIIMIMIMGSHTNIQTWGTHVKHSTAKQPGSTKNTSNNNKKYINGPITQHA